MSDDVKRKAQIATNHPQGVKSKTQNKKQTFICDRCGFEMYEKNCKVICPNCGNRFDCSDLNIYFD